MSLPRFTRRGVLAAAGVSLAAGAALDPSLLARAGSDPPAEPDGWPMPRRDPARTGFDPDGPAPRTDFAGSWEASVPAPEYRSRPLAVADDVVYALGRDAILARDADTGGLRWRFDGAGTPWRESLRFAAPPQAFGGGVLTVDLSRTLGFAPGGRLDWGYDNRGTVDAPVLVGDTAYWSVSGGDAVAVDAATGLPRDRSPLATEFRPQAFRDGILVGGGDSPDKLVAVDAATGSREWTVTLGVADPWSLSPCVGRDAVYYGSGPLSAISLDGGDVLWEGDVGARRSDLRPVTDGDRVYAAPRGEGASAVVALDAGTGERVWRAGVETPPDTLLAVVDDTVYAPTATGFVALDAAEGTEIGRFDAPSGSGPGGVRSPVVADGTVHVGVGETLYAVEGSA